MHPGGTHKEAAGRVAAVEAEAGREVVVEVEVAGRGLVAAPAREVVMVAPVVRAARVEVVGWAAARGVVVAAVAVVATVGRGYWAVNPACTCVCRW